MPWYKSLHNQIFLGILLGVAFGCLALDDGSLTITTEPHDPVLPVTVLGQFFLAALKMIVVPLILASIVMGVAGLGDIRHLGSLSRRTVIYYFLTTFLAVVLGLILVNALGPGRQIDSALLADTEQVRAVQDRAEQLASGSRLSVSEFIEQQLTSILVNPFRALAEMKVLPIIIFALLLGGILTTLGDRGKPLLGVFDGLFEAMMIMTGLVMYLAPVGVFGLMVGVVSGSGLGVLVQLGYYMLTVLLGLGVHGFILLPALLWLIARRNPILYFLAVRDALLTAFSTSSSSASLPVTIRCTTDNAKVPARVSRFVLPLGATINMDGTALYEAVGVVFLAQVYDVPLSFGQQIIVVLTATLAAIGAAGIPSAGTVTMLMVLEAVNFPQELMGPGIALILSVDRILDMCRTTVNVWGDSVGCAIVAHLEGDIPAEHEPDRESG